MKNLDTNQLIKTLKLKGLDINTLINFNDVVDVKFLLQLIRDGHSAKSIVAIANISTN